MKIIRRNPAARVVWHNIGVTSKGRIALVTGAGSGIGRAASLALQAAGYSVVIAGRRLAELEKTTAMANPLGGKMLAVATDVSKPESVNALFARIGEEFGRLDVLFNNAGLNAPGIPIEELTFETWSSIVNVNLTGAFLCAQAAFKMMKDQQPRGGRIINNGSIAAFAPQTQSCAIHSNETRHHRAHEMLFARWPEVRHRLQSNRYRQCRD